MSKISSVAWWIVCNFGFEGYWLELLKLYQTFIRQGIDYRAPLYAFTTQSRLNSLNTIHNTSLGLVTGAFRTTSRQHPVLYSEPPFTIRRHFISTHVSLNILTDLNFQFPLHFMLSSIQSRYGSENITHVVNHLTLIWIRIYHWLCLWALISHSVRLSILIMFPPASINSSPLQSPTYEELCEIFIQSRQKLQETCLRIQQLKQNSFTSPPKPQKNQTRSNIAGIKRPRNNADPSNEDETKDDEEDLTQYK